MLDRDFIVTEDYLYNPPLPFTKVGVYFKVRKLTAANADHPESPNGVLVEYYDDVIDRETLKLSKGRVRIPKYFATQAQAEAFAARQGNEG